MAETLEEKKLMLELLPTGTTHFDEEDFYMRSGSNWYWWFEDEWEEITTVYQVGLFYNVRAVSDVQEQIELMQS